MNWEKPEHSKTKANKAARDLIKNKFSSQEKIDRKQILDNFRASHGYPMQSMITHIRNKAFEIDKKAIVVRRLKRMPSILSKLKRYPNMQLTTMGDIGGLRVILKDMESVEVLYKKMKGSGTKNKLEKEYDYLKSPKDSGYRGIHLIYSYQGSKAEYKGLRVELQIRSQIQHYWATAVEVVGTFLKEPFKASSASPKNEEWLAYFERVSRAFACLEQGDEINTSLADTIFEQTISLRVFDVLSSLNYNRKDSLNCTRKFSGKKNVFYLMQLDIGMEITSIRSYSSWEEAYDEYLRIEKEIAEDETKDVVLVSAYSLKQLKKAYPNYFADIKLFLNNIGEVLTWADRNGITITKEDIEK